MSATSITPTDALDFLREIGIPTTGNFWWTCYPARAIEEIHKMQLHTNAQFLVEGNELVWAENIITNFQNTFYIAIVTGDGFPHISPKAYAPGIPTSKHKFAADSLCLFHPSEYSSRMSILQIRNVACSWCFAYEVHRQTGEWPAAEEHH